MATDIAGVPVALNILAEAVFRPEITEEEVGNKPACLIHFYAPASKSWAHVVILFSVCLSIYLSAQT